jgi:hypothetical protein
MNDRALRLVCVNQEDDDELVARLRAGDWSALDGLYHRYAFPVVERCWRVLRELSNATSPRQVCHFPTVRRTP